MKDMKPPEEARLLAKALDEVCEQHRAAAVGITVRIEGELMFYHWGQYGFDKSELAQ